MSKDIQDIQALIENNDNIIALYNYGSYVYGTQSEKSDKDVILVVEDLERPDSFEELSHTLDVNIYDRFTFEGMIAEHEITALECMSLPKEHILKEKEPWSFILSLPELRKSISATSSNSWVKAKKKFIVEKDKNEYIGKKSAWHAIRILDFGTQIAKTGKIENYSSQNALLPQIMECQSWEEIDSRFRKLYNETATQFRLVAPKEVNINRMKP